MLSDPALSVKRRADVILAFSHLPKLSPTSTQIVLDALTDPEAKVRKAAIETASKHKIQEATKFLRQLTSDVDPDVRFAAMNRLSSRPQEYWLTEAKTLLRDTDANVIRKALSALADVKKLSVDDARPLFRSENPEIRRSALWALGDMITKDAHDLFIEALIDPDQRVRIYAVQALRKLRMPESVPILHGMLDSEQDATVLENVVAALAENRTPSAVLGLIDATRHRYEVVRYRAVEALATRGDTRAIPALRALLHDSDSPDDYYNGISVNRVTVKAHAALARLEMKSMLFFWLPKKP